MAEMWDGCETCHHYSPTTKPSAQALTTAKAHAPNQADAAVIPACKSCHSVEVNPTTEIRMPSLKGAYHRQCLNCHREWTQANACVICHAARSTTGGRVRSCAGSDSSSSSRSPSSERTSPTVTVEHKTAITMAELAAGPL